MKPPRVPLALVLVAVSLVLASLGPSLSAEVASAADPAVAAMAPVIAAAGNIACDPSNAGFLDGRNSCHMGAVSDLLLKADGTPAYPAVLALGDNQYTCGGPGAYDRSYGPTWGRVFSVTKPVVGDKDYRTTLSAPNGTDCQAPPGAALGFFGYFGSLPFVHQGRLPGSGAFYSFEVPRRCTPGVGPCWHFIALNGNCRKAVGCEPGTRQYDWLAADLLAHPNDTYGCTAAFWHWPRFSSGAHGSDAVFDSIWRLLYQNDVDVVLNAHEHVYERFAPQDPSGAQDPTNGIRQFIVGTGGASHMRFPSAARLPTSEVSNDDTFGILTLTLHQSGYDWDFIPEAGKTFTDASSMPTSCH